MTTNTKIPFLDLVTPHIELEDTLVAIFRDTLRTAAFVGGSAIKEFEDDFAAFSNVFFCVGVGSGTDAVRFALLASGVRPGDAVLTVPNTFIATAEAISQAGAVPEFIDVNEATYNMESSKLGEYLATRCDRDPVSGRPISRRTRRIITAVVPVHLYGQIADMDAILEICDEHRLVVVEDACQAHGAEYFSRRQHRRKKAGSFGKAAAFSFYPGKNLGACGEAGAVTTNDAEVAQQIRMLRDHGQAEKYYHQIEGYNGRLDTLQASILREKLRFLQQWNNQRRERADTYRTLLSAADGLILPFEPAWSRAIYHLFVVRVQNRDQLQKHLFASDIVTGIHYPIPLHLQRAYNTLGYGKGDFPVAEKVAAEILSLPMYPQLTSAQQERVATTLLDFLRTDHQPSRAVHATVST